MFLGTTKVEDFDRWWRIFSTKSLAKRKQHGCKSAQVFRDPNEKGRVWVLFDWDAAPTASGRPRHRDAAGPFKRGRYACLLRVFAATMAGNGASMATSFASEAAHIRAIGHLSVPDLARATGANETTVRAWLRDERSPSGGHAERLAELSALVERLVRVMEPTYVPVWMRKPIPLLDDDKPLDVIAAGEYRRVSKVLAGLESPGAA